MAYKMENILPAMVVILASSGRQKPCGSISNLEVDMKLLPSNNPVVASTPKNEGTCSDVAQKSISNTYNNDAKDSLLNAVANSTPEWIADAANLSAMELNAKYRLTYNAYRSMIGNHKQRGKYLDPALRTFKQFLIHLGPKVNLADSLDRIENTKGYVRGNLRWASKKTQSRNRSNVIRLTYKGKSKPLVEWAEITNQDASLMRRRRSLKWSSIEIIEGKRSDGEPFLGGGDFWTYTPWPTTNRIVWEKAYQKDAWAKEHRLQFYNRYATALFNKFQDELETFTPDQEAPAEWDKNYEKTRLLSVDARRKLENSRHDQTGMYALHLPGWVEKRLYAAVRPK